MKHFILAGAVLLAACDEKKDAPPATQPAIAAKPTTTPTPSATAPATAVPTPIASQVAPKEDVSVDGPTILARMGTSVCKAFERCDPPTLKSLGGLDKCAATMTKSPPPGFNKKKASCTESQLSTCLKVYEDDAICSALKGGKKQKDPPECLACGIK